jgi:hypothetical protein
MLGLHLCFGGSCQRNKNFSLPAYASFFSNGGREPIFYIEKHTTSIKFYSKKGSGTYVKIPEAIAQHLQIR